MTWVATGEIWSVDEQCTAGGQRVTKKRAAESHLRHPVLDVLSQLLNRIGHIELH